MHTKKKSFLSILLAAVLALSLSAPALAAEGDFSDVAPAAWYRYYVSYAAREGLLEGTDGDLFAPDRPMTRGEFVTALGRLWEKTTGERVQETETSFLDVPADQYYALSVSWAAASGLVQGCGAGVFRPEAAIDRESAATILGRYLTFAQVELAEPVDWFCGRDQNEPPVAVEEYADCGSISPWALEPVGVLSQFRVMTGTTAYARRADGNVTKSLWFQPQKSLTRAEGAALLTRLYQAIRYAADTETACTQIPFSYEGDAANRTFLLGETGYQVISDEETYGALLERVRPMTQEGTLPALEAPDFAGSSLLAVELQVVGCPIFALRLTDCTVQGETAQVTFLEDAHGSTADVSGYLCLIPVPKTVERAEVSTAWFVHQAALTAP